MARRGENIYKRKDGRYEGRYIKYYDMSGKAVYGYVYSKSYAEIKEKLAKCKTERQSAHQSSNTLLCDWLEIWLMSQGVLKPTTKRVYKSHIENHINPQIGSIPLKKLNTEILQNFINNLELSASTIKTVFSTLKSALTEAEDKGFITNVWSRVKLPKKDISIARVLSTAEQQRLEKVLTDNADMGILICLYTGLRIGELCALKWTDINFELSLLTVNGTQARTEKGVEIISPKSKTLTDTQTTITIERLNVDGMTNITYTLTVIKNSDSLISEAKTTENGYEFNIILNNDNIESFETAKLVVALYDNNGKFICLAPAAVSGSDVKKIVPITTDIQAYTAKVMLWNDLNTIKPLCIATEITIN